MYSEKEPEDEIVHNEETKALLEELRESMTISRESFVFACGGSVPIGHQ